MTTGATPAALTITCATCGTESTGARFCPSCGAPLQGARCSGCDSTLLTGARYCHRCGTAGGATRSSRLRVAPATPWVVAAVSLLALVVLIVTRRPAPAAVDIAAADPSTAPAAGAPDISAMSPAERADRLFDRVMRLHEEGKDDSVQFFRPMVLSAYQMIGPLDLDQHYDLGEIGEALGMMDLATAEADTILRAEPTHLLGLALAARVAAETQHAAAARGYYRRLLAAAPTERQRPLPEYTRHDRDITTALAAAAALGH
jgi:hypothetical protein